MRRVCYVVGSSKSAEWNKMIRDFGRFYDVDEDDVELSDVGEVKLYVDPTFENIMTIQGAEGWLHMSKTEALDVARAILNHFGEEL